MKLSGLLNHVEFTLLQGTIEINIKNIVNDSRNVKQGSLFICIIGFETDGHQYIDSAIAKGAKALLVERDVEITNKDITIVKVDNTRKVLAVLADKYYNQPSRKFRLAGITGTNGKTSTVFLIKSILEAYNKKTGIIGTIENRIGHKILKAARTTPESIELQELFYNMAEANVNDVIMEVSSHALDLHRVDACQFDVGVFTNLTLDHLDYHNTMENYRDAKLKLFKLCDIGVINSDDPYGQYMIDHGTCKEYITYGCNNEKATLNAYNINSDITGAKFNLNYKGEKLQFELLTPGKFSIYNALAAIGVCIKFNVPIPTIIKALKDNSSIKGRFETFASNKAYYAIVDYAHTPDGLKNVLDTILEFAKGNVITVFGCGGDRDKTKRPEMAEIAGNKSDYAIITSDNPRTEDPISIIEDVEVGMKKTKCPYEKITDRKEAIVKALSLCKKDDIVLIAGKGHEDYQIVGKTKIHFDDSEIVLNYFQSE